MLAASLAGSETADVQAGLRAYQDWMRPVVDEAQKVPPGLHAMAFPSSRLGLAAQHLALKVVTSAPLAPLAAKITHVADPDLDLPEIPDRR